jgi:Arc/MetJ-type ribon-helix-helix transcriptional regulator
MTTTQITIRLPDDQVGFIDELVEKGEARSRAAAVSAALRREQRRRMAEHDAAIYAALAAQPDPDDLEGLARWASGRPLGLDD